MRMKRAGILFVVCICLWSVTGCNTTHTKEVTANKITHKQVTIGVIYDSFIIERWQRDRDAFVSMAQNELGAKVNIQTANGDVKEQLRLIHYFIDKKVDVLVIVPIDCEAITDAVQKAKEAGIKIISYDRLIKNANVDLYITFDNQKVGRLMGQTMINQLPNGGKVIMMCGPKTDNNVGLVGSGFKERLKGSNIKVIKTYHASGWLAENGYQYISSYLEKHKEIDGIMCGNDGIAGQVIHALSEKCLAGKVCVVGQDADLDACQRIVEGTQIMTVYKPVAQLAQLAASYAVQLGKGKAIHCSDTFSDGSNQVPYIGLNSKAITKKNMNVIIDDGFHMKDDVYLNIQ